MVIGYLSVKRTIDNILLSLVYRIPSSHNNINIYFVYVLWKAQYVPSLTCLFAEWFNWVCRAGVYEPVCIFKLCHSAILFSF